MVIQMPIRAMTKKRAGRLAVIFFVCMEEPFLGRRNVKVLSHYLHASPNILPRHTRPKKQSGYLGF